MVKVKGFNVHLRHATTVCHRIALLLDVIVPSVVVVLLGVDTLLALLRLDSTFPCRAHLHIRRHGLLCCTLGANSPEDYLSFVDEETVIVVRGKAWSLADRARNIHYLRAIAAYEVMMIVV